MCVVLVQPVIVINIVIHVSTLPRLPRSADHARAFAPPLQEPADALVRDGKEELLRVSVRLYEVQTAGLRCQKVLGTRRDEARELQSVSTAAHERNRQRRTIFSPRSFRNAAIGSWHSVWCSSSSRASGKTQPQPRCSQTWAWYVA